MTDDLPELFAVAALILAAGSGSRMGLLKQVMPWSGGTLLWHVIDTATDAALGPVIVVVGAEAETVREAVAHKDVIVAENPDWQTGMGSSIATGIRVLLQSDEQIDGVAILLADQPKVTARHLSSMRTLLQASGVDAVAAEYGGTIGVPAFFRASCFAKLAELPANVGAKPLLLDKSLNVARFELPEAEVDVDTPGDLKALD